MLSVLPLPGLVLVHGGAHAGDCWDPTVAEVRRLSPRIPVLAVDLPGRAGKPGDLATATIGGWADSVIADIDAAGLADVVLVGHSMAGVTVPEVAARLGQTRVREIVLVTAFVPPQGRAIVDTLDGPLAPFARLAARFGGLFGGAFKPPNPILRYAFCNGMTPEQRRFNLSRLHKESIAIVAERVDRRGLSPDIPRTWVLTTRDRALSPASQQRSIDALGGVETIIRIDACHNVMISHPQQLARILVERCQRHTAIDHAG
ncbi:2-succinyl-6-hydroxy-2,4-cyclohexadiene-1-carboxylate synthase [Mycolicibacterium hassiacum DSM 44199]|jgi:pimeloyl-ACP methyl ester carboxylesterase|nr:2-succinyl-6-hydroxy-2,4-cyclohexadiene-1-carboxylate synthase [Mycolicibacterium hassiacum DSM 44199]